MESEKIEKNGGAGENGEREYDRYLFPRDVFALSVGVMVGWGAFVMPGTTFLPLAGPLGSVIAIAAGALLMMVIARNFASLMNRHPGIGGVYAYTKEVFGRDHAFLSSWFLCLSYLTIVFLNGTALFIVFRTVMNGAVLSEARYQVAGNDIYVMEVLISVLAFGIIGFLAVKAKPFLQKLFTVLAGIMLAGAAVTAVICIPHALSEGRLFSFSPLAEQGPGFSILSIVLMAPWAFAGFDVISFETAHFRFPMKKSKGILMLSIPAAALFYAALSVVGVSFVPDGYASWSAYIADLDHLSGIEAVPTFRAAEAYMGSFGLVTVTVSALCAIFTGIIGAYRAAMRVLITMAEDRILSERFRKTKTSILFIMLISIVLSMLGRNTLNWFVDLTSFGAIVGFGYTSAAAWKIGRREGDKKAAAFGAAGTVISVAFGLVQILPRVTALDAMGSEAFLLLAMWCLLGFFFYLRTVNETTLAEFTGMSSSGVALFALLVYAGLMWMGKNMMASVEPEAQGALAVKGVILMVLIFFGLVIMLYIQNRIRLKHEELEREKIRAVEGSLAKSQFLFNMSHDIRTPMNAIIGYTGLARKENDVNALHGYLEKIEMSSQHLLMLLNDILEMSRIESGKVELEYTPTDLKALCGDIYDLFIGQMRRKGLTYTVETGEVRRGGVWCDRKRLSRVLMNLVSNAYKFTPEGGSITVTLREITGKAGNAEGYGSYEIRVKDSGIGMSAEFKEKMFNAFERERTSTVSRQEGTGLGLAITKSFIDLMGGTVEVLTEPGRGTEFVIHLRFRLAAESELPAPETGRGVSGSGGIPDADAGDGRTGEEKSAGRGEAEAPVDFTGMRLLLVEDNAINMEIAQMILSQMGFVVETAENGQEAVDRMTAAAPGEFDLILMDIQMPVMDGYAAARAIRALPEKEKAEIPIVAMTANAFAEDVQTALAAGMQAHVAKPVDIAALTKTLQDILGKR